MRWPQPFRARVCGFCERRRRFRWYSDTGCCSFRCLQAGVALSGTSSYSSRSADVGRRLAALAASRRVVVTVPDPRTSGQMLLVGPFLEGQVNGWIAGEVMRSGQSLAADTVILLSPEQYIEYVEEAAVP